MPQKPQCHNKSIVAQSNLFTIEQMHLEFENGEERVYERIVGGSQGAVMVAAVSDDNHLLLVREYAAGIDDYELAFPKGRIEPNEPALDAANRELQEEVGYAANHLTEIKKMTLAPSYFGAHMNLILARGLYQSKLPGDEPEPVEVVRWPLAKWRELLARHDFTEARSIAALYLVMDWLETNTLTKETA